MKQIISISILIFLSVLTLAQEKPVLFTLNDCVSRAMAENIDLKIQKNREKKAMLDRQKSQWQLAPSINGGAGSSLNLRRSTNQNNEISSGTNYTINYGLSSSLVIFGGFTKINTIAAYKYNELAYKESTQYLANQLYLQIIESYTMALYQKAMVEVLDEKLEISKKERDRIEAYISEGLIEPVALYEIEATVSGNELERNRMENNFKLALIQLSQLIEWANYKTFNIAPGEFEATNPEVMPYNYTSVYSIACANLPQIKQKEYTIAYLKKALNVSKGNMLPSLSVNGGYSSGFYSTDTLANGVPTAINDQFSKYLNPSLGLSLNIPIFNGFGRNIEVKKSKVDLENGLYELENEKKLIGKEIVEAIQRLEACLLEYESAMNNLKFVEKSFETYREKYRLGLLNSTDFITAQNQLAKARTDVIAAKYSWVVQNKIIELYMGKTDF
ncbi:MAG: TolC family protein [Prolixibacteraceae bacterium]|nr:TolC family protein [Prolixibacteraceae bacterium]